MAAFSAAAGWLVRGKIVEKNNMFSNDSKLPNSARNAIKNCYLTAAENWIYLDKREFEKYFLLTYLKSFFFNIFKSTGEALNLRYTWINENLKKIYQGKKKITWS